MAINTVAILSPGDMGHSVGRLLREHQLKVVTCLTGRSDRTRALAQQAGIADVPNLNELVQESDLVMSITVSEVVPQICRQVADAMLATRREILFAECNAIAPSKAKEMEPIISDAGGRFVDVSIIGGPPHNAAAPGFTPRESTRPSFRGWPSSGWT